MDVFKKLFGVAREEIRPAVIMTPLDEAQLFGGGRRARGDYFRVTQTGFATVIGTHYSLLVGDCALALGETPCREIYLFGCCGSASPLTGVGEKLLVEKAFGFESFTQMLNRASPADCFFPDKELHASLSAFCGGRVSRGAAASVSSLALEADYLAEFARLGVNCLDMEAAQVFAAAAAAGKKAAALFYVSNSVPDKSWHEQLSREDVGRLSCARKSLAALLCDFIRRRAV